MGSINADQMVLNQCGYVAQNAWQDLPNHHDIELDEFIVMPNHIHGIVIINNPVGNGPARSVNNNKGRNNLSIIMGSYKSAVTKQINRMNNNVFKWQKSFYDHVIRTTDSLNNIREYIVNNPRTWDDDENNIKNHKLTVQAGLNPTGRSL